MILKRNHIDRSFFRALTVAADVAKRVRDISWCVPRIDPSNDTKIMVEEDLNKKNNIDDFSYYEI